MLTPVLEACLALGYQTHPFLLVTKDVMEGVKTKDDTLFQKVDVLKTSSLGMRKALGDFLDAIEGMIDPRNEELHQEARDIRHDLEPRPLRPVSLKQEGETPQPR